MRGQWCAALYILGAAVFLGALASNHAAADPQPPTITSAPNQWFNESYVSVQGTYRADSTGMTNYVTECSEDTPNHTVCRDYPLNYLPTPYTNAYFDCWNGVNPHHLAVEVHAHDANGTPILSATSPIWAYNMNKPGPPHPPSGLNVTPYANKFNVTWADATDPCHAIYAYDVAWSLDQANWHTVNNTWPLSLTGNFQETRYFKVRSVNSIGRGDWSNVVSASTGPPPAQCTPASQTISANSTAHFGGAYTWPYTWASPSGNPTGGSGSTYASFYNRTGTYNVTLNTGYATSTCIVNVIPPPPVPVCAPATQTVLTNQAASFTSGANFQFGWKSPSGNPSTGSSSAYSTSYRRAGNYTVTVTNAIQSSTCRVHVDPGPPPPPVCSPSSQTVATGHTAQFSSGVPDGVWSAPQGSPNAGTGYFFSASFYYQGTFNIGVSNDGGQSNCYVNVQDPQQPQLPPGNYGVCGPHDATILNDGTANLVLSGNPSPEGFYGGFNVPAYGGSDHSYGGGYYDTSTWDDGGHHWRGIAPGTYQFEYTGGGVNYQGSRFCFVTVHSPVPSAPTQFVAGCSSPAGYVDFSWQWTGADWLGSNGFRDPGAGTFWISKNGTHWSSVTTSSRTAHLNIGVADNSLYQISVITSGNPTEVFGQTIHLQSCGVPTPPLNLTAVGGIRNVTLTWNPPSFTGGTGQSVGYYTIYRHAAGGTFAFKNWAIPNTYVDTDVTPESTYWYEVTASDGYGESPPSNVANATPYILPPPPFLTAQTDSYPGTILTFWFRGDDGGRPYDFSELQASQYNNTGWQTHTLPAAFTNYNDTGLVAGQTYFYRVRTHTVGGGYSPWSNIASATTWKKPGPPTLHAQPGDRLVNLTWDPPAALGGGAAVQGYLVWAQHNGAGPWTSIASLPATQTSAQHNALGFDDHWTYYVNATNPAGVGPASLPVSAKTFGVPGPPSHAFGNGTGDGNITVTWQAPFNNGGYAVTTYSIYAGNSTGSLVFKQNTTTLAYTETGLARGQTRYVALTAWNQAGQGNRTIVTATAPGLPDRPRNVQHTTGGTPASPVQNVTWLPPTNTGGFPITNYTVYRTTGGFYTRVANTTNLYYADAFACPTPTPTVFGTPPPSCTGPKYRVTAWNRVGQGRAGYEANVTFGQEAIRGTTPGSGGTLKGANCPQQPPASINLVSGQFVGVLCVLYEDSPYSGLDLPVTITHRAAKNDVSVVGANWYLSLDRHLDVQGNTATLADGTGRLDVFTRSGSAWTDPAGYYTQLTTTSSGATLLHVGGMKETFDAAGHRIRLEDAVGNNDTFTYDSGGNLVDVVTANHRELVLAYSGGRLQSITDNTGRAVTFAYSGDDLQSVTLPSGGPSQSFTYYQHNLWHATDARGTYLNNTYKGTLQVARQVYGAGAFTFSYGAGNTTVTDQDSNTVDWTFNSAMPVPATKVTRASVTGDPGHSPSVTTTYTFNTDMEPQTVSGGVQSSFVYDTTHGPLARGNLLEYHTGTPDSVTKYTYEPVYQELRSVTTPDGNTTTFAYTQDELTYGDMNGDGIHDGLPSSRVVAIFHPDVQYPDQPTQRRIEFFQYTAHGQVWRHVDADGGATDYTYDANGNVNGTYQYPDRVTVTPTPMRPSSGAAGPAFDPVMVPQGHVLATRYTYDAHGYLATITDPSGNVTTLAHDNYGRLTRQVLPGPPNEVLNTYDADGNLVQQRTLQVRELPDGSYQTLTHAYRTDNYTYDTLGHRTDEYLDITGDDGVFLTAHTHYGLDKAGNVVLVRKDPSATGLNPNDATTYIVNEAGQVVQTTVGGLNPLFNLLPGNANVNVSDITDPFTLYFHANNPAGFPVGPSTPITATVPATTVTRSSTTTSLSSTAVTVTSTTATVSRTSTTISSTGIGLPGTTVTSSPTTATVGPVPVSTTPTGTSTTLAFTTAPTPIPPPAPSVPVAANTCTVVTSAPTGTSAASSAVLTGLPLTNTSTGPVAGVIVVTTTTGASATTVQALPTGIPKTWTDVCAQAARTTYACTSTVTYATPFPAEVDTCTQPQWINASSCSTVYVSASTVDSCVTADLTGATYCAQLHGTVRSSQDCTGLSGLNLNNCGIATGRRGSYYACMSASANASAHVLAVLGPLASHVPSSKTCAQLASSGAYTAANGATQVLPWSGTPLQQNVTLPGGLGTVSLVGWPVGGMTYTALPVGSPAPTFLQSCTTTHAGVFMDFITPVGPVYAFVPGVNATVGGPVLVPGVSQTISGTSTTAPGTTAATPGGTYPVPGANASTPGGGITIPGWNQTLPGMSPGFGNMWTMDPTRPTGATKAGPSITYAGSNATRLSWTYNSTRALSFQDARAEVDFSAIQLDGTSNPNTWTANLYANGSLVATTTRSYPASLPNQTMNYRLAFGPVTFRATNLRVELVASPNPHGRIVLFDSATNPSGLVIGSAVTTTREYDDAGRVKAETDGNGNRIQHTFDGNGRLNATMDALGQRTTYRYDKAGNLAQVDVTGRLNGIATDAPGTALAPGANVLLARTKWTYDSAGELIQRDEARFDPATGANLPDAGITPGDGYATTRYMYDPAGRLATVTNDNGGTTQYFYDGLGHPKSKRDASGTITDYTMDVRGNVIEEDRRELMPAANVTYTTLYGYDAQNRLTRIVNNAGETHRIGYDARGHKAWEADAKGGIEADPAGAYPGLINDLGNVVTYTYDTAGNLIQTDRFLSPDGNGYTTPTAKVTTQQAWDTDGHLISQTDDQHHATTYGYDNQGHRTTVTYPDGTRTKYRFDANGNLLSTLDAAGNLVQATYNGENDRIQIATAGPGAAYSNAQTFQYDGLGRVTTATDNNDPNTGSDDSTVTRTYDSQGNVLLESQNGAIVGHAYDGLRDETGLTYPSGRVIAKTYDTMGRLKLVTDNGSPLSNFTYGSRLASEAVANLAPRTVSYDTVGRVSQIRMPTDLNPSTSGHITLGYAYDRNGNIRASTFSPQPYLNEHFAYDSLDRLTGYQRQGTTMAVPTPLTGVELGFNWTLDGVNDWQGTQATTAGSATDSRTYNNVDQIVNLAGPSGAGSYAYNAAGDTLQDAHHVYVYDALHRLRQVKMPGPAGPVIESYAYDAFGRRITSATPTSTTTSVYDGVNCIQDTTGTTKDEYIWGQQADQLLAVDWTIPVYGTQTLYAMRDVQGSVIALQDQNGHVMEAYVYNPYGQPTIFLPGGNGHVDWGSDDLVVPSSYYGNAFMYTGQRYDSNTGLYDYKARMYDPATGRFLTRDPIGSWGDPHSLGNGYAYTGQNPTLRTDSSGKCPCITSSVEAGYWVGFITGACRDFEANTVTRFEGGGFMTPAAAINMYIVDGCPEEGWHPLVTVGCEAGIVGVELGNEGSSFGGTAAFHGLEEEGFKPGCSVKVMMVFVERATPMGGPSDTTIIEPLDTIQHGVGCFNPNDCNFDASGGANSGPAASDDWRTYCNSVPRQFWPAPDQSSGVDCNDYVRR